MKKLLLLLMWLTFSNVLAIVPEDGVYIITSNKRTDLPYYPRWHEDMYRDELALLVIVNGMITQAYGPIYVESAPRLPGWPRNNTICPDVSLDLQKMDVVRQNDGSFMLSYNIRKTETDTPEIEPGKFFALYGVLNFDTPTTGKYRVTTASAYLTQDLQGAFCTMENVLYVIKL